jgi:hypothetical protein
MGILSSLLGNSKKLPFKKIVRFERKESEFEVNIGDEVKIWNKPNTKKLNLYAKGSVGGNGLVGTKLDSIISYHLTKTNNLIIENKVVRLKRKSIELLVTMYSDEKAVQERQQNNKTEWIEKLNKKYNPKTSWELRFFSEKTIEENDFLIETIDKSQIEEFYQKNELAIWLTDKNGNKISAENRVRSGGTEKTLRAVFSGHELEVLEFTKEQFWYFIEIGIKKPS